MTTISKYAQSVINRVKYETKNDASQQDMMRAMVADNFEGVTLAEGVEITSGAIITRMREVVAAFSADTEKDQKNRALTIMRNQLRRAFSELDGTDNLTVGLKAASAKKVDRIEITAKPVKAEKTLADQIAALVDAYGLKAVVEETAKLVEASK